MALCERRAGEGERSTLLDHNVDEATMMVVDFVFDCDLLPDCSFLLPAAFLAPCSRDLPQILPSALLPLRVRCGLLLLLLCYLCFAALPSHYLLSSVLIAGVGRSVERSEKRADQLFRGQRRVSCVLLIGAGLALKIEVQRWSSRDLDQEPKLMWCCD